MLRTILIALLFAAFLVLFAVGLTAVAPASIAEVSLDAYGCLFFVAITAAMMRETV